MTKCPRPPKTTSNDSSKGPPDHEIGHGHPPLQTRFKPGQSGNPKGRPKGRRNMRTVVEENLQQRITVREGARTRSIRKFDAYVLAVVNKAVQGDAKAQAVLLQICKALGMTAETPELANSKPVTNYDEDIINNFLRRQRPPDADDSKDSAGGHSV